MKSFLPKGIWRQHNLCDISESERPYCGNQALTLQKWTVFERQWTIKTEVDDWNAIKWSVQLFLKRDGLMTKPSIFTQDRPL